MTPNDLSRVREEKARLYQSAVEAWGKGEVTSALNKLEELAAMDRDFPDPDSGPGNTYRNFYNQVNSENEALKVAYEEARGNLASGNPDAAMAICRQYLAKYPNHALFLTLKSDIEASQRPKSPELLQAIAEIDQRMQQEGDLNRRVALAESALARFPGEPHFEQAVKDAREMRDLVESIATQARFFEQQGQLSDALDQWQILRSIHSRQPGVDGEIQRLIQRREEATKPVPVAPPPPPPVAAQPPRPAPVPPPAAAPPPIVPKPTSQVKGPWVEQAQKYLDLGDYQRAMQAVSIGLAESPSDPELLALDAQVRKGQDSAGRALELLGKAHDEMNKGATEAARGSLREAFQLDPRNAVIRTVLVNSLLEEARSKMDLDPGRAQSLVQEVLRMEPGHAQATILAQGMAERKPAPPPPPPPPVAAPPSFPPPPLAPVSFPHPPPAPPKVASPPSPTPSMREAPTVAVPASVTQALLNKDVPPAAPPPPVIPPPAPKPPAAATPKGGAPKGLLLGTGVAVVLLLAAALGVAFLKKKAAPPPVTAPSTYAVVLKSIPEGAEIKVDGVVCGTSTCTKDLAPGNHQLEASLSGYLPATMTAQIGQGAAKEYNLLLNPLGPRVALVTDLADGTVALDENPPVALQGGAAEVANLSQAKHTLTVKGADSSATIPLEILSGAAPVLTGAIDAKNARAFVVAGFGGDAKVYGSGTGFRASLDGKPVGLLAPAGLPLQGLTPGTHELAIVSDIGQQDRMVFESQPSATLYVMLGTAQNLGTLSVEITNEDQAHLILNGQKYKRDTARGRLVVYLFPRKYTVTVQKDGFAPAVEQTVEVKRGQDTKVSFTLSAAKAILAVHHAPPGADVAVDNISRGTVHPDGEYQVGAVEPGKHTVTLRRDGFRPLQSEQTFTAGKTLDLEGKMEAAPTTGTLRFEINPAGIEAHIRIKRDGDAQERDVTGISVNVPEGHYVVNISAPQHASTSTSVQVTAGGTAVAAVTLRRLETKAPPKTGPSLTFGLEDWLKTPGWSTQDGMITHKGGDWVMATPDIAQGTIRFTVVSLKGRHVEWAVASRDEKNFVHYELDDKNIARYEVRNGSKLTQIKVAHGLDKKKPMGITLEVAPQSIVLKVQRGGWVDLDKWDSGVQTVHGRFGFRIPGSDEIGLQDFAIQP